MDLKAKEALLKEIFGENWDKVEIVDADLLHTDTIYEAVRGCDYVIHVDTPYEIWSPKNEEKFIKPAVESTLAILKACNDFKIKRLIVTSSTAAVVHPWVTDYLFSEKDWIKLDKHTTTYPKSKFLQEKACWDYIETLSEKD